MIQHQFQDKSIAFDVINTSNLNNQNNDSQSTEQSLLHLHLELNANNNSKSNINAEPKRKFFKLEEDLLLQNAVIQFKHKDWNKIAQCVPGRTPKQCRDRWTNYLHPSLKFTPWTSEENQLLISLVNKYGTHWSKMKKNFPNRSTNSLKNRWYSLIKDQVKIISNPIQKNINPSIFLNNNLFNSKKECFNQYSLIENVPKKQYCTKNINTEKTEGKIKKIENVFNVFAEEDIIEFSNDELNW